MKKAVWLFGLLGFTVIVRAEPLSPEMMAQVKGSLQKGVSWLQAQQKPNGSWSEEKMPALSALPLWAMAAAGIPTTEPSQKKAVAFLLSCQNPDGGVYVNNPDRKGGGLGNYNTCISVMALFATGRKDLMPAVLKARAYIASSQHYGDDSHDGGFGYDQSARRLYTDLNNTHYALDAMRRTQAAEDFRPAGEKRVDVNWDSALKYVERMQNTEGDTKGGFAYNTTDPKGGAVTNAQGKVTLLAYGSISYAGLLSLIHAQLTPSDPRVRSALDYASKHWTLEENPGQGQQGIYFYYNIISRALSASGVEEVRDTIRWREDVVRKVLALQKADGSWVNENNRWWENDPVLATAYALLALEFASGLTR